MENKIKGGKADKMSIEDIAKKHKMDVDLLKVQINNGIEVEKEHTSDKEKAKEIAMDHLFEFPDYYIRLKKMEKEAKKKTEAKESMGADCSGSYEAPFSGTILKKDIHTLHNWKTKQKEVEEQMDAGVSAGAMYDGPIGTAGPSSPMDKTKKRRKDPLAIDNAESASTGGSASITAASTNDMISTKKGFPRFGGPDAKFVEIDKRCKTFPYCNQGDDNQIKLVSEAIQEASKKYGIPVEEVGKLVSEALPTGMFGWDDSEKEKINKTLHSWADKGQKQKYKITTEFPIDITTTDDMDIAKLKLLFYKYDIKFKANEIKK